MKSHSAGSLNTHSPLIRYEKSHHQRGVISLIIMFLIMLTAGLYVLDLYVFKHEIWKSLHKLQPQLQKISLDQYVGIPLCLVLVLCFLVFLKDTFTVLRVRRIQKRLLRIATRYHERFDIIQKLMISNYSRYDNEAISAINEARALLGTVLYRLSSVSTYLATGKRVHKYDALACIKKPLQYGEDSISALIVDKPFPSTSLGQLEKRLQTLIAVGERPVARILAISKQLDSQKARKAA